MSRCHLVDEAEFDAGDFEIHIELTFWEQMLKQGYKDSYEVTITARPKIDGLSQMTIERSAPVYRVRGWPFNRKKERLDVSSLIQEAWKDLQERIDKVSDRTAGTVTVDFEVGAEAAEETATLNGDIDQRLADELSEATSDYGSAGEGRYD